MKIYKTMKCEFILWADIRDEDEMVEKQDLKPKKEQQVFLRLGVG